MGFVPNSLKIMARRPALMQGFLALAGALNGPSAILPPQLRQLVAHIASAASGCRYCQAHTAHNARRAGAQEEKIAAVWEYETSPLFSESERAALSLAQAAGSQPNMAGPEHFEAVRRWYSDDEVAEIVGVIALFGFLNRWNDTLATPLEESPTAFAEAHLSDAGWTAGKHG
ncbi:MAG TPA: fusion protein [Hyphomonas sp.]|nr:fusion protein [Hyphomonas sp.]